MRKMLLYELEQGCLSISNDIYRQYCQAATALHPEAAMLVPEELLNVCTTSAKQLFEDLMKSKDYVNSQLPCNYFDDVIKNARKLDIYPVTFNDFIDYLQPYPSKLQLKGEEAITILMTNKKYYMRKGRKTVHIASLTKRTKSIIIRRSMMRMEEDKRMIWE